MKRFVPMIMLFSLVSCNGSNSSKSPNIDKTIEKYRTGLTIKRGLVAVTSKTGEELSIDFTTNKFGKTNVNEKERSIVLFVNDDDVYKLIITDNLITGESTKEVSLEKIDAENDLRNLLKRKQGKISGDNLLMKGSSEYSFDTGNGEVVFSKISYKVSVNLLNAHCESINNMITNVSILKNGSSSQKFNLKTKESSVCGKPLNAEDLKALDLKTIKFCEYIEKSEDEVDVDCKYDQDMSFLTADL